MKKRWLSGLLSAVLLLGLLVGCGEKAPVPEPELPPVQGIQRPQPQWPSGTPEQNEEETQQPQEEPAAPNVDVPAPPQNDPSRVEGEPEVFSPELIPAYTELAYVPIHENVPYFTSDEMSLESFEYYSPLDELGRCGITIASVGQDLMPDEERETIGMVKPTGWHTARYDHISGKYLYNRCHLIGFQLCGENANDRNLITGTRYLNIEGMLPFENMVADYVKETGNHVMYRVTPVFEGNDLVARGVLMEGYSVEDQGGGICFCVFAYNIQPGVEIDYATGESKAAENAGSSDGEAQATYIVNTKTEKFHLPTCESVEDIKKENMLKIAATREEMEHQGYTPCGRCKP